jgi:hypothetical protein
MQFISKYSIYKLASVPKKSNIEFVLYLSVCAVLWLLLPLMLLGRILMFMAIKPEKKIKH